MSMYGADVAELRSLAAQFDRTADQLDANRMTVGNAIQISAWVGPFAARFRMEWNSTHSARVHGAAQMLRANAGRLRHNADEQEQASAVDGGAAGPGASAVAGASVAAGVIAAATVGRKIWDGYGKINNVVGTAKIATGIAEIARDGTTLTMKSSVQSLEKAMRYSTSYRALSRVGEFLEGGPKLSKVLGPIGVVFGVVDTVEKVNKGETGLAILSGVSTALAAAALVPTPATPFLAAASAVVGVTSLVIEHREQIAASAKSVVTTVSHVANDAAKAVGAIGKATGGFVASVAGKAASLWPWK